MLSFGHHISPAWRNGRGSRPFVLKETNRWQRARTTGSGAAGGDHADGRVALPGVEVLAVELLSPSAVLRLRRPPRRGRPRALRARHAPFSTSTAPTTRSTSRRPGPSGRCASRSTSAGASARTVEADRRPTAGSASAATLVGGRRRRRDRLGRRRRRAANPVRRDRPGQSDRRGAEDMSQEIIEGIQHDREGEGHRGRARSSPRSRTRCSPRTRRRRARRAMPRSSSTATASSASSRSRSRATRGAAARGGARGAIAELEQLEEETGERQHTLIADDDLDLDWSQVPDEPDRAHGRDARQLRPHRRADREAGHPAADPRGGARDHVRGVRRPRRARSSPASSSRPATATTCSSTSARSRRCCRAPSRSTASATSRAAASRP